MRSSAATTRDTAPTEGRSARRLRTSWEETSAPIHDCARPGPMSRNSSAPGARPISPLSSISAMTGSFIRTRGGNTRWKPTGTGLRSTGSYSRCREKGTAWTTARRRTFSPRGRRRCSTDTKKSSAASRNSRSLSTNTWTGTTTKE